MALKLIALLAFLALAASAHGYVLVTTHFNDSSCSSESKIAQFVYSSCPTPKRSIQVNVCSPLTGVPDHYYLAIYQCGGEILEPEPVADWQLLRSTATSDCNYTASSIWTIQVGELGQDVYVAAFFGNIVPSKVNMTCGSNGVLFGAACDASCYPFSVGTNECKDEYGLDYITQSTCVAAPVAAPESTPSATSPVSSPVAAPVASPTGTPSKTPTKTSSASVVAGSALFVTLLTLF